MAVSAGIGAWQNGSPPDRRLRQWGHCPARTAALTDASVTNPGTAEAKAEATFPPTDLPAFLHCCAGDWLSLRSRFNLGHESALSSGAEPSEADNPADDDNSWHASERAELQVTLLVAPGEGHGGLAVEVKGQPGVQRCYFHADGSFGSEPDADKGVSGKWSLGADGSLDLVITAGERQLKERIWFTKPNLRLRSTVEQLASGSPGRASFSSEIRRVPRPATPGPNGTPTAPKD